MPAVKAKDFIEQFYFTSFFYFAISHYSSATPDDLWIAMQSNQNRSDKSTDINLKDIIKAWTNQMNYPVLNVVRDYKNGDVIVEIGQYINISNHVEWFIPVTYVTQTNINFNEISQNTTWLTPYQHIFIISGIYIDDWIIINKQQAGKYNDQFY
jgi:aminopeptidase N